MGRNSDESYDEAYIQRVSTGFDFRGREETSDEMDKGNCHGLGLEVGVDRVRLLV